MTTDRLFVIMLVLLIPMTGCFGALDNADAEENTSETIVNNYYYNNTTTVVVEDDEYFTVGGMFDRGDIPFDGNLYYYPHNFSTTAGQFVTIHYLNDNLPASLAIQTTCDDNSSDR
ncbi:MAG: hypothetical protein ISR23_06925, partial [Candidatus Poseidoniaceae archaeon]|nr:hypothetical protein [Candidatus Poseidoniaceae archaeon]